MKDERLNGYVLHHRPYQEKRVIYRFFSYEFGVVQGIGARGLPLFAPIHILANGKHTLKTFSQSQLGFADEFNQLLQQANLPAPQAGFAIIAGRVQYALLYMNEILYKLLATENACPTLWQAYHHKVCQLIQLNAMQNLPIDELMQLLRAYLREFERVLFAELGVSFEFTQDWSGAMIDGEQMYRFVPEMGFVSDRSPMIADIKAAGKVKISRTRYAGKTLMQMEQIQNAAEISFACLSEFGQLQKELLDYLLEYRPLHSRTLWQQSMRYQNH